MLILTRSVGRTILIGDNIRVTVMEIERGQVRLGVDAPKEVRVDREELRQRIEKERNNG